jgi:hypothetical protein
MSLAMTNVDLLHRGWEDAVSEIKPHFPEVRATMETKYAALVHDDRLDEQSLLAAAQEVASMAGRVAGADKGRLLSRALHRAVYEFLLSLDAMTPAETDGAPGGDGVVADPSRMIGVEEIAELEGRQSALLAAAEQAAAEQTAAEQAAAGNIVGIEIVGCGERASGVVRVICARAEPMSEPRFS